MKLKKEVIVILDPQDDPGAPAKIDATPAPGNGGDPGKAPGAGSPPKGAPDPNDPGQGGGKTDDPAPGSDPAAGKAGGDKNNAAFAALRVENTALKKTVGDLQTQMNGILSALKGIGGDPGAGTPGEKPLLERLAEDPITVIREVAVAAQREESTKESFQRTFNDSRKRAMELLPALRDPNSYEFQVFDEICAANPGYFKLPNGPMLAMKDTRDRLIEEGRLDPKDVFSPKKATEPTDLNNGFVPAGAPGAAGVGMKPGGGPKAGAPIELDAAQMAYCKSNGIDPKVYKQILAKNNPKGGYTI